VERFKRKWAVSGKKSTSCGEHYRQKSEAYVSAERVV
jgi:hypothetical protein